MSSLQASTSPPDLRDWIQLRQQQQQLQHATGSSGTAGFSQHPDIDGVLHGISSGATATQWHSTLDPANTWPSRSMVAAPFGSAGSGSMRCGTSRYNYPGSSALSDLRPGGPNRDASAYGRTAASHSGSYGQRMKNPVSPDYYGIVPQADNLSTATCPSNVMDVNVPRHCNSSICNPETADFQDAELQEAIRQSIEEAERRQVEEDAEIAQVVAIAAEAEEAEQRSQAEEAKRRSEAEEAAAEENRIREEQQAAARRCAVQAPLPPPPGLAETFGPRQWLNDASISLAYAQLAAGGAIAAGGGNPLPEFVLLMDPATAFWLTLQEDLDQVEEVKGVLKLQDRQLVLCPINDSRDGGKADAGTHWTLLVCWDRGCGSGESTASSSLPPGQSNSQSSAGPFSRFCYYDSLLGGSGTSGGANLAQARTLASRLAGRDVQVLPDNCPNQTNCFDCGIYVLLFSEIIARAFIESHDRGFGAQPSPYASKTSWSFAEAHDGWSHSQPVWQSRVESVTPMEVSVRRARYFESFVAAASTGLVVRPPLTA